MWRIDQGAFHVGKISGLTGLNANETRGSTGNFSEQTDDPPRYSTFSVPAGWDREIPVQFAQFSFGRRLAPGLFSAFSNVWRWALITGCRSFSFHFLSYRSKWNLFKIVVSSVRVQISWNETATTAAISTIGKKAFPFHPEGFRNFQSEIFPKWKAPRAPSWVLGLQITVICEIVHLSTKAWTSFHCVICMLVGSEGRKSLLCRSRRCYLLNRSILFQAFR